MARPTVVLPQPRLADQRKRLAREDSEVDAVDGAHVPAHALQDAAADREPGAKGADFEKRVGAQDRHGCTSRSTRWQQAACVGDTGVRTGSSIGQGANANGQRV
jgi:hypothetical protein